MSEAGIDVASLPALGDPGRMRVLMYHRIVPDGTKGDPHQLWLPESQFRRQVELLDRWGYTAITFEDYRLFLQGELNLPRKPVVITFNDGYAETYRIVFPILQEYGMRAVVFVVADPGVRSSIWDRQYPAAVVPLLADEQILEMHTAGFEIGSHTLHHKNLRGLPRTEAWEEISRSRMLLEILLNAPVRTFAYPFGLLDEETKKMVHDAGYTLACAGWTGPALFGEDPFEIRRITVLRKHRFGTIHFALRLFAPYQFYRWVWWRIRVFLELTGVRKDYTPAARR